MTSSSLNAPRSRSAVTGGSASSRPDPAPWNGRTRTRRRRRVGFAPLLFIAPGFALFLVLVIYPMVRAFQMSFYDWNVVRGRPARSPAGTTTPGRSRTPCSGGPCRTVPSTWPSPSLPRSFSGSGVAVLLNNKAPARALFRVLFYLPVVSSWVVVSLLFQYLFADSGLVNWVLHDVTHLTGSDTSWLSGRWTGMVAISALGVWKGVGWSMMIFLAALQGVPRELLESAAVDGAGPWQRFKAVTLPAIWPAGAFVTDDAGHRRLQRLHLGDPHD